MGCQDPLSLNSAKFPLLFAMLLKSFKQEVGILMSTAEFPSLGKLAEVRACDHASRAGGCTFFGLGITPKSDKRLNSI